MRSSEKCFECLRLVIVLFLLLLAKASMGGCIRPINKGTKSFGHLFDTQLPRGPVPPSGPSPCHNKLDPYDYRKVSYSNGYIICP
ncbi:hypothetical protein QQP08_009058 [Theobroma cacao]|nr:hypothetical protein QQP08_009058 [Theobroma cacao]